MATIDKRLHDQISRAPCEQYHVIVRADEAAGIAEVAQLCLHQGMVVHHQFDLLPALALTATGTALLDLAHNPHVRRIEPDRVVGVR